MKNLKIAVITGGPYAEHDISLQSGQSVTNLLQRAGYEAEPVVISRDGRWSVEPAELKKNFKIAFIAMHGKYGEDGTVQDILGQSGMLYTGSGILPSALAINKLLTGKLFQTLGLNTPRSAVLEKIKPWGFETDFDLPVIVKPVDRGLSLGVSLVRRVSELDGVVKKALDFSKSVLVEEYIPGREISCIVIDDGQGEMVPLAPAEVIAPVTGFHDYYSKHTPGASEWTVSPHLQDEEQDLIEATSMLIHQSVGASGISKTDMILGNDGQLYILEINTIPRFTETDCLSVMAPSYGLSLTEVCERIIEAALRRASI